MRGGGGSWCTTPWAPPLVLAPTTIGACTSLLKSSGVPQWPLPPIVASIQQTPRATDMEKQLLKFMSTPETLKLT